ncbi:MAG: hypothetical protein ACR2PL_12295 [Dehalococcoidia bacterium]
MSFRTLALTAVVVFAAVSFSRPAAAAAPRLLMVYGAPLPAPIILDDWRENLDVMLAMTEPSSITPVQLSGRPSLELALFWGEGWDQELKQGPLRPEQATQRGRYFPAVGDADPVVILGFPSPPLIRLLKPVGAEILARHGVPARLETVTPASVPISAPAAKRRALPKAGGSPALVRFSSWLWPLALILLTGLGGTYLRRRRSS